MNRQFVPPGYIAARHVIEVVVNRLFPAADEAAHSPEGQLQQEPIVNEPEAMIDPFAAVVKSGLKPQAAPLYAAYKPHEALVSSEVEQQIYKVLHTLRALLYEKKLTAFYVSPLGGDIAEVSNVFWLGNDADHALGSGEYWPFGRPSSWYEKRPMSPLLFKEGEAERALDGKSDSGKTKASNRIGRPDMKPAAMEAYWRIYPNGHSAEGHSWKVAADRVSEKTGDRISEATLKRAVRGD